MQVIKLIRMKSDVVRYGSRSTLESDFKIMGLCDLLQRILVSDDSECGDDDPLLGSERNQS